MGGFEKSAGAYAMPRCRSPVAKDRASAIAARPSLPLLL